MNMHGKVMKLAERKAWLQRVYESYCARNAAGLSIAERVDLDAKSAVAKDELGAADDDYRTAFEEWRKLGFPKNDDAEAERH